MIEEEKHNLHERYHIPNLKRALEIFELLAKNPAGLGMSEIARRTKYSKNSIFRIICTLEDCGYVVKNGSDRTFRMSRKLVALGYASFGDSNIVEKSMDVLRAMRDELWETSMLGTLLETGTVILEQAPGKHPFKFLGEVGMICSINASAPSKAMLAYLPPAELEMTLKKIKFDRFNENTIYKKIPFEKELQKVREQGYATDICEENIGVHCVGAPIFDAHSYPVASIWITGPRERMMIEEIPRIGARVRHYADIISARLGHVKI